MDLFLTAVCVEGLVCVVVCYMGINGLCTMWASVNDVTLWLPLGSQAAQCPEVEKLTQYFQDLSAQLTSTTQELVQKIQSE